MKVREIKVEELNPEEFIAERTQDISSLVGKGLAINALSGGVDSSAVTMLGHKALGKNLKTYFINNGLMRQDEPQKIVSLFQKLGVPVEIIDAQKKFFQALKGITDPEEKEKRLPRHFIKMSLASWLRKARQSIFYKEQFSLTWMRPLRE